MVFKYISKDYPLILASSSPRRRILLSGLGIPFKVLPSQIKGEENDKNKPEKFATGLAIKKARNVYLRTKDGWVLGADTIVVLNENIIGKPNDYEDAKRMLRYLSGKEHIVITGFCILNPSGEIAHIESVKTKVKIRELSEEEIEAYLNTKEPFDKAGAYAVQGIGAFMIKSINGSYTNVVGLPLCELITALKKIKALKAFP